MPDPARPDALAVVVVARDEEDRIGDCLASVSWADELVVVVDAATTDRTAEIAREHGASVVVRPWAGFVEQKNFALERATCPWVLSLDADERVSPRLAAEIREAIGAAPADVTAADFPRRTFYLGRWIAHGGWYPDRKTRLVRRGRGRWTGSELHERLEAQGRTIALGGDLLHHTYRDLSDHLRRIDRYTSETARAWVAAGRRASIAAALVSPPLKFIKMYLLQAGFLDGAPGLFIAALGGYYVFLKHAKHWELTRVARRA